MEELLSIGGGMDERPRWQLVVLAAAVWGLATVITGAIYGNYPVAALGTATGAGIFTLVYATARDRDSDSPRDFLRWAVDLRRPSRRDGAAVALVLVAGIISRIVLGTVQNVLLPSREAASHATVAAGIEPSAGYVLGLVAFAVFVAPILEELVFRNGLQKLLAIQWSGPPAIVVTSLVFTLLHVPSYGGFGAPAATLTLPLAVVFVDSTLYGWAYHRTGNVVVAMVAHGASNALAVLAFAL